MATTPYTEEDRKLLECLPKCQEQLRKLIDVGRPYVWELRLSLEQFYILETAIADSISSHSNDYHHLLSEDFAVILVMYLAEWYKRFYKGADTMNDNKVITLSTEELKKLYQLAKIDANTFVYNASTNPDKTSYRWLESLQVLGGLAVQAELKRDKSDALLPQLCKIFHGEEIELDDLKDRNRAVAFQESIARKHSLYEYLDCILSKEKEPPFAKEDMNREETCIPQLLHKILEADEVAKKNKFDFEWVIAYTASRNQMIRHLRVKMKPEEIGGGKKQYIGYDRLQKPEWGIEHPEEVGRIRFYLRFKDNGRYVQKLDKTEEPLFKYDNTGSEKTGFLSVNKIDENTYTPYYTEYQPLQCLCLQILRMEEVKFGETDEEICGILFDGAWLWEEYLNTILQKEGFRHPENKKHKGGIYLFDDHSGIRYPDFYKDDIVLDAKYKKLESYEKVSEVNRNDLHQLITYITNLKATKGVFIAPLSKRQQKIPRSRLTNSSASLYILGIEISKTSTTYMDFCEKMKAKEAFFVDTLRQI